MSSKPKILFLTDSVSLPRRKNSESSVALEDTYLYKLREKLIDFELVIVAIGGATIKDLRNQVNYYALLRPEIVFIQCGIVDCAPRAFGKLELEIFKKLKIFRFTKPFVKFLRKFRGHKYTSLKKFEKNLLELQTILNPKKFYTLSILPSNSGYEKKAPGITRNIQDYNAILRKNSTLIDLSTIPRNGMLPDHHHINEIGHKFIYECICEELGCE